jgi:hypothetical protein
MPAIAADRSELEQPVQDPTADLSSLTNSEIDEAAEFDAQLYFKADGPRSTNRPDVCQLR